MSFCRQTIKPLMYVLYLIHLLWWRNRYEGNKQTGYWKLVLLVVSTRPTTPHDCGLSWSARTHCHHTTRVDGDKTFVNCFSAESRVSRSHLTVDGMEPRASC